MSEERQYQEVNTRQNLEKLTSDDLWKETITEEVKGLKADLNRMNAKIDHADVKLDDINKKPSLDKSVLFFWAALFLSVCTFSFVIGFIVGGRKFLNNQQSSPIISLPAQENPKKPLNHSRGSRQSVLPPASTSKKAANTNTRQKTTSPDMHKKSNNIRKRINSPVKRSNNQPGRLPKILKSQPGRLPKILKSQPGVTQAPPKKPQYSSFVNTKWEGINNQYPPLPRDTCPTTLYIEKVNGSHFTGKIHIKPLDNAIFAVQGKFIPSKSSTQLIFHTWLLQGGNLRHPFEIIRAGSFYAYIRDDGYMVGRGRYQNFLLKPRSYSSSAVLTNPVKACSNYR
jgi:hypothetical protein